MLEGFRYRGRLQQRPGLAAEELSRVDIGLLSYAHRVLNKPIKAALLLPILVPPACC